MLRVVGATLFISCCAVSQALAQNGSRGASAPEIDGPAGVAAIAVLVGAGLIAYNRYRKK
jgi:hypothetical protein